MSAPGRLQAVVAQRAAHAGSPLSAPGFSVALVALVAQRTVHRMA